jgi:hypothetical protein
MAILLHALRDDPIRYPPPTGVNPGGGASLVEGHDGFAANILNCRAVRDELAVRVFRDQIRPSVFLRVRPEMTGRR